MRALHMAQPIGQVYTVVVEAIKERIASGELLIGQRLPSIQQLAQEFGVSTGSVREAARVLEAQGMLRIAHGRGMFVTADASMRRDPYEHFQHVGTGPSLAVFEARRVLEPELAVFAAERATAADVAAIRDLAATMEQTAEAGGPFIEQDVQFHRQVALAAKNPILARMMDGINDLLIEGRMLTVRQPESIQRAMRYHTLIAGAIADHNPIQARLLMLAHVNDAIDIAIRLTTQDRRQPGGREDALTAWRGRDRREIVTEPERGEVV
jgi:GntR family transcriptional regulator, transcriptional repressor for pyruvate dehydrogenase complex